MLFLLPCCRNSEIRCDLLITVEVSTIRNSKNYEKFSLRCIRLILKDFGFSCEFKVLWIQLRKKKKKIELADSFYVLQIITLFFSTLLWIF